MFKVFGLINLLTLVLLGSAVVLKRSTVNQVVTIQLPTEIKDFLEGPKRTFLRH